jgi:Na+/H+ antiporter NhaD/arsenite permease-like protein
MTVGESITVRVADSLETCAIPYLLSGSFASNYYGVPSI